MNEAASGICPNGLFTVFAENVAGLGLNAARDLGVGLPSAPPRDHGPALWGFLPQPLTCCSFSEILTLRLRFRFLTP